MSSYRTKFLKLKYDYKRLVNAFSFLKWALKHATINGTPFEFPVPKCGNLELEFTDGVNPVTPDAVSVVGNTVTVEVPAGTPQAGRELMPTGQTTVFRTGDDADNRTVNGRAVDFFTLDYTNPFGNTNRFTDELGGSTYANDIVIDWSTYNNVTGKVLGYRRVSLGTVNWNTAIDNSLALSVGTFTSGWRLANNIEINSIANWGLTSVHNYAPFNINTEMWSSTTYASATSSAWRITAIGVWGSSGKTNSRDAYPVRTFTVTGTTLS
jgi:hypothetical protein